VKPFICIHGHFYQPPRENPWLEEIELQDSAYPYHDWNTRITTECYAPNAASRILDPDRRIIDIINNYSKISFNFGPTLLAWLEKNDLETYKAVLEADKVSQKLFSDHGCSLAQCYNHMIMPLANRRDKRTQVIWGIKDFEYRFERKPEGMWLPETAVDLETLDILAELGIKFTILAPAQAKQIRKIGADEWINVSGAKVDPKRPYLCKLSSGRTIALFFYDGPIAQEIAFAKLLENGEAFAKRLISVFAENGDDSSLVHIATDGESYGHHHRFGDMALSYCLYSIESNKEIKLTVYGEYLEKNPVAYEVEIFENSSWSCFHGIERWRGDCGCNSGTHKDWHQKWRAPLRGALDWLRDNLSEVYEKQALRLINNPWAARDEYIKVILDRRPQILEQFFTSQGADKLSKDNKVKLLKLLEMQRHAMLMYTSCGWFFDEISGLETVQILQYAARAIQLAKETSEVSLEEAFINLLERVPSNIPDFNNGAKVYELLVKPVRVDLLRVGIHYAISSLFEEFKEESQIYCYTVKRRINDILELGKQRLSLGRVGIHSNITGEENEISFAVLHFGDHNLIGAAREFIGAEGFAQMHKEIGESFMQGEMQEVVRLFDKHFGQASCSLWHLFKDEQRKVIRKIFDSALKEIDISFRQIYEHYASIMQATEKLGMPLPKPFLSAAEFVLNVDIRDLLESEQLDLNKLRKLANAINRFSISLDKSTLAYISSKKINTLMEQFLKNPEDFLLLEQIVGILRETEILSLDLNLWKAQNVYFSLSKQIYPSMCQRAEKGDEEKKKWIENFHNISDYLKVKII